MGKQKLTPIGVAFAVLILLVVAFMVRGSLRQPPKIVLPAEPTTDESSAHINQDIIKRVSVRPDTVQSAIATLVRPTTYSRTVTVERYWNGGSGIAEIAVRAADGYMRLDTTANGDTRHVILGEETTYIWYGSSREYYAGASSLSQDAEQGILTYEDILAIDSERIAIADYRELEGIYCIYVETAPEEGYVERYWVCVDTGLLIAAERLYDDEVIYRMAALNVSTEGVDESAFTLPDGTAVYTPNEEKSD